MEEQNDQEQQQQIFAAFMHQYTIKAGIVYKDGIETICPFTPRIPIQNTFNKIEAKGFPCTTACPKCNLTVRADNPEFKNAAIVLQIACNGNFTDVQLTEEQADIKKTEEGMESKPPAKSLFAI